MTEAGKKAKRMKRTGMGLVPALAMALSCLSAPAQSAPPNNVEATSTPLIRPQGVAYDASGNYYIADTDQNVIRKVSTAGIITTVAGDGEQGYAGDGGPATAAILDSPAGVAVDSSGNIYIADTHNNVIREVLASNGNISTIAGTGVAGYGGDSSAATGAVLNYPMAVAVDSNGNVYIADTNNHRIREITGTTINTVAGDGEQFFSGDGGPATAAGLDSPNGVAVDAAFNIYIGDTHNQRVREVIFSTGNISTLAGTGGKGYNGDGTATSAELARPRGVAVDSSNNVYVADSDNNMIRSIGGGNVTTIVGNGTEGFSGDGGAAMGAWLDMPGAVAARGSSILFSDTGNNVVREENGATVDTTAGESPNAEALVITGPSSGVYGSITLTATFSNAGNTGSGQVTFYDGIGASPAVIGSASLSGNAASVNAGLLSVGTHSIFASYAGDANNPAVASGVFVLTVLSPPAATLTSPAGGSVFTGPKVMFTWNAVSGATGYSFRLGTTPGANNLFASGLRTSSFVTATGLPVNGETIYGQLITYYGSVQVSSSYTFTAIHAATLTSPAGGTTLIGPKVTFTWNAVAGATGYSFRMGSTPGANDLSASGLITATSTTALELPTNSETVYGELITYFSSDTVSTNYTFTAAAFQTAALTSPAGGSVLSGSSVLFTWNAVAGVTGYSLRLGSTPGANDLYASGVITGTSKTVSGLPTNGETIYGELITYYGSVTVLNSYTFTAAP